MFKHIWCFQPFSLCIPLSTPPAHSLFPFSPQAGPASSALPPFNSPLSCSWFCAAEADLLVQIASVGSSFTLLASNGFHPAGEQRSEDPTVLIHPVFSLQGPCRLTLSFYQRQQLPSVAVPIWCSLSDFWKLLPPVPWGLVWDKCSCPLLGYGTSSWFPHTWPHRGKQFPQITQYSGNFPMRTLITSPPTSQFLNMVLLDIEKKYQWCNPHWSNPADILFEKELCGQDEENFKLYGWVFFFFSLRPSKEITPLRRIRLASDKGTS